MTEQDEPRPEDETPKEDAPEASAEESTEPSADAAPEADGAPEAEESAAEPVADESTADAAPDAGGDQPAEEPPADAPAAPDTERQRGGRRQPGGSEQREPEAIPGAHLEPDLVLDESPSRGGSLGERSAAEIEAAEASFGSEDGEAADGGVGSEPAPVPASVLELAADARYRATGKRKNAVARVTLRPGTGVYTINGRELDRFFPRPTLQRIARGPLETVGHESRMDVVATIHGGGVSGQAGALRHGVARALVEADPSLRSELKRRGFLTRDPRVKERKKAGLKKARKRPQFSKR